MKYKITDIKNVESGVVYQNYNSIIGSNGEFCGDIFILDKIIDYWYQGRQYKGDSFHKNEVDQFLTLKGIFNL